MKFETSVHINDNVYTERVILKKKKKKPNMRKAFFFHFSHLLKKCMTLMLQPS